MHSNPNSAIGNNYYPDHSTNNRALSSYALNTKPIGLYNIKNSCYISAVLQILFVILPDSLNPNKGILTRLFY